MAALLESLPRLADVRAWEAERWLIHPREDDRGFVPLTFPGYVVGRHHRKLCACLEAVERGDIRRLIVEMPPRMGKSELMSIRFPAWYLGRNPRKHIIACSYAASLAYGFSRQARNLLKDSLWPFPPVSLADDAQGVEEWLTNHGGGYVAAGVGGPITGHGADVFLIDDPLKNREEADSETVRENQWQWYTSTARTRLQPKAAIVLTLTRWHEADLAGRLLKAEKQGGEHWETLVLPALAMEGDPLGRAPGEPLWPEWYSADDLDVTRRAIGSRDWAALYQQRPQTDEGAFFRRLWFQTVSEVPKGLRWVRYWDLAASTSDSGDYTASAKCAFGPDGTLYVADVVRGRWEWPEALAVFAGIAKLEPGVVQGVEGIGVQRGFRQLLLREPSLRHVPIVDVPVLKDKQLRAAPWQARAESDKLRLVLAGWNGVFIDECCTFPLGEHDDMVDAVSGAVGMLARGSSAPRTLNVSLG